MRADFRKLRNQVMSELKRQCDRDEEVHHVFGRTGRLAACRLFCVRLTRPRGGANHHDHPPEVLKSFRDNMRAEFMEFCRVNYGNRDQTTCWYRCMFAYICPLYEQSPIEDLEP